MSTPSPTDDIPVIELSDEDLSELSDSSFSTKDFDATDEDKRHVQKEIERLRTFVADIPLESFKNGDWFAHLLTHSLRVYAQKVDAEYFRTKYPHLPADAVVDARIELAAKYAGIEGFLTSSAYSGAVAATVGSGGGASPLTVPGAIASFGVDLVATTDIQLKLAYDIATLYGVSFNLEDPEDLWKLIRIALAIKATEGAPSAISKSAPAFIRVAIRRFYSKGVLDAGKSLPVIGRYLLQRNVIKFAIPAVTIPLTSAVNYWTTKGNGLYARQYLRSEARIKELAARISSSVKHPVELMWVMWAIILADGDTDRNERLLLHEVTIGLAESPELEATLIELRDTVDIDYEKVIGMLKTLGEDGKDVYDAAVTAAAINGRVSKEERAVLKLFAEACGIAYDDDHVALAETQAAEKQKKRRFLGFSRKEQQASLNA